jgi:hypothetical protein
MCVQKSHNIQTMPDDPVAWLGLRGDSLLLLPLDEQRTDAPTMSEGIIDVGTGAPKERPEQDTLLAVSQPLSRHQYDVAMRMNAESQGVLMCVRLFV